MKLQTDLDGNVPDSKAHTLCGKDDALSDDVQSMMHSLQAVFYAVCCAVCTAYINQMHWNRVSRPVLITSRMMPLH